MKEIIISHTSDANQRFDKFLKKFFPNAPLGALYKMLRTGKIRVNGKKKSQTYRLQLDDRISVFLSDDEIQNFQKMDNNSIIIAQKRKIDLLYQDEYFLVVNKKPSINVHPGDHKTKEVSLIELVHDFLGKKYNSLTFKPALVHRLDRDTSGCIIIALQKNILEDLLFQLQNHKIQKVYHTLVFGIPKQKNGTFSDNLLRKENVKNEAKVTVHKDGQKAVTHYKTIKTLQKDEGCFSLLECQIETGRTHQIRVHCSYNNVPIVGDKGYGNKSINSICKRKYHISRQLLHSYSLTFVHPKTKKPITFTAPYPNDFTYFLEKSSYEKK